MRVWIDISNSPQVPFFKPLIRLLEERDNDVHVTARDLAQTLDLLRLHSIAHEAIGPAHGGASMLGKAHALARRALALRRYARNRGFDLVLSHASHEPQLVARALGIPSAYAFDYEFARIQHGVGCRAARRVVVPDAIPQDRLARIGASASKVRRYAGLKEEYYLSGFEPDRTVLDVLGLDRERVLAVVRTPPEVALYHRHGNPLFEDVLERLGRDPDVQVVVLPRTREQGDAVAARKLPSLVLPEHAVDAQSLVALADLVVSGGGTMNREAAALGTPVFTVFAERLGAVDEALIREGRLLPLRSAADLVPQKRQALSTVVDRDPAVLLDLLLTALDG